VASAHQRSPCITHPDPGAKARRGIGDDLLAVIFMLDDERLVDRDEAIARLSQLEP
jgi:hypothetical protein